MIKIKQDAPGAQGIPGRFLWVQGTALAAA